MNPFKPSLNKNAVNALCALLVVRRRRLRRRRKYWTHPIVSERLTKGKFVLLHNTLKKYPDKFFEYHRMSISSFEKLLSKIKDKILKKDTTMRDSITPEEKLAVTLR